ncbi:hypothetical protein Zm00014a_029038 [Zea mays]|uniref:Uncharacterized protein n=1 Tax=Zea mays TaxID=4577 RepID=A0A3L6FHL9_MAIZE|nr:hypothetical protein Zm00014a_029038 [Zea mays]
MRSVSSGHRRRASAVNSGSRSSTFRNVSFRPRPRERRPPVGHLVDEHPERPPVDRELVPVAAHHLRRHVLLGAHERERPLPRPAAAEQKLESFLPRSIGDTLARLRLLDLVGAAVDSFAQVPGEVARFPPVRRWTRSPRTRFS